MYGLWDRMECSYDNCQFGDFLYGRKKVYYKEKNEKVCIFHLKEKRNFDHGLSKRFQKLIDEYIEYRKSHGCSIDFTGVHFIDFIKSDLHTDNDVIFDRATFEGYFRLENIFCRKLSFTDTIFLEGGEIRRQTGGILHIEKIVFNPFHVENDFVVSSIDSSESACKDSCDRGQVKLIKFENHKSGRGKVYFIGMGKETEGDFRRNNLDSVIFQHCSLENFRFLYSKVINTEFTNCTFPLIRECSSLNLLDHRTIERWLDLADRLHFIEYLLFIRVLGDKENSADNPYNRIKTIHHHIGIYDAVQIYNKMEDFKFADDARRRAEIQAELDSLTDLYQQLKVNFEKNDYQKAGDFFYAQRYTEILSGHRKALVTERPLLKIHYTVNGFGERFLKPLIWLFVILAFVAFWQKGSLDHYFLPTEKTPAALLCKENEAKENEKKGEVKRFKTDLKTSVTVMLINIPLPFKTRFSQWVEPTYNGYWLVLLTNILFWFLMGAFVLAIRHRIKR